MIINCFYQELLRNSLGLIGDIASSLGPQVKSLVLQPFVEKLTIILKNDPDQNSKEIAEFAYSAISELVKYN